MHVGSAAVCHEIKQKFFKQNPSYGAKQLHMYFHRQGKSWLWCTLIQYSMLVHMRVWFSCHNITSLWTPL